MAALPQAAQSPTQATNPAAALAASRTVAPASLPCYIITVEFEHLQGFQFWSVPLNFIQYNNLYFHLSLQLLELYFKSSVIHGK